MPVPSRRCRACAAFLMASMVCFDGVMDALRALDKLSRVESRAATRASDRRDRRGQDPTDGGVRGYLGGSPQMNVAR
jgi:hypothetical protein